MLRTLRVAVAAFMLVSFNQVASAQMIGVEPAERLPVVTLGAGIGPVGSGELAPSIVVQRFLTRRLVFEADFLRWNRNESRVVSTTINGTQTFHRTRSGWSAGASLLFRTSPRRASWFAGGGLALLETFEHDRYVTERCIPPSSEPRLCDRFSFSTNHSRSQQIVLRGLTGADVRIAGPVSAYGLFEIAGIEGFMRFSGGVRVTALSRDAARIDDSPIRRLHAKGVSQVPLDKARGQKVQMLFVNGSERTAVLTDLTATEVAVRGSGSTAIVRYPLEQVRLVKVIENKPLKAAAIGLGAGAAAGLVLALSDGNAADCIAAVSVLGAMGAGGGFITGLVVRSQEPSNVVWIEKKRSVRLGPIVTPTAFGAGGAIRW